MLNVPRRILYGLILAPIVLVLSAPPIFAVGRLRGVATTRAGEPIEGVLVKMVPAQTEMPTIETTSNKKGKFVFGLIRPADYRLVAFKEGMRIARVDAIIAIPEDDDFWEFNEDVVPGAIMPTFNVTGVTTVEFNLKFEETAGGVGAYGTGVPISPTKVIVEAVQEGRLDEAIQQVEQNLEAKPDSPILHYLHSFALKAQANLDGALAAADKCLALDPTFEGGYLLKAKIREEQGQPDEAMELYKKELEIAESVDVLRDSYLGLAGLQLAKEQHEDAAATLEKLIEVAPDHVGAYKELAGIYIRLGDQEKARVMMDKVTEMGAEDPNILYNLGAERFNAGDFEMAAEYFTKTIESDPSFQDAHLRLAFTRLNLNDRDGAKQSLEKFLELSTEETADVQTARAILEQLNK